jgi:hypothetical protein
MTSGAKNLERGLTILELLRPHKKVLWLGLLAISGESVADLLEPWPLKIVLDNVISHKAQHGWLISLNRGRPALFSDHIAHRGDDRLRRAGPARDEKRQVESRFAIAL